MKAEIAAMAVDDAFADAAEPGCSYQPPGGGDPVTEISVILAQPDEEAELGEIRAVVASTLIDVRISEVTAPARGGIFIVAGVSYTILAAPRRWDRSRLVWRCPATETSV